MNILVWLENLRRDIGATAAEYAIMVSLVAVVVIAVVTLLGLNTADLFEDESIRLCLRGVMNTREAEEVVLEPDAPREAAQALRRQLLPFSLVLGVLAGLAVMSTAVRDLRDIDLYWHILAGSELAAGTGTDAIGATWSFAPRPLPWVSTQWLAEIAFYGLHAVGGWGSLIAFRVVTTAVVIAALAASTLRGRPVCRSVGPVRSCDAGRRGPGPGAAPAVHVHRSGGARRGPHVRAL